MKTFMDIIVAIIGLGFFGFSMIIFVGMNAKIFSDLTTKKENDSKSSKTTKTTRQEIEEIKQRREKLQQEIEKIQQKRAKLEEEHARIDSFGFHLHSKRRR